MTQELNQENIITVIRFEERRAEDYLDNLHLAMNSLVKKMREKRTFTRPIINFFQGYDDIISTGNIADNKKNYKHLTVSNTSGLPMYSRVHTIQLSQKNSKSNLKKSRDEDVIVNELFTNFYKGKSNAAKRRFDELRKRHITEKLIGIKSFSDVLEERVKETYTQTDLKQHIAEYAGYPVTDNSCLAVSVVYSNLDNRAKIPSQTLENYCNQTADFIYENARTDKAIPVLVRKAKTHFYFKDRDNVEDEAVKELLEKYPDEYVLKLEVHAVEDLNLQLANSSEELLAEMDSPLHDANVVRHKQAIYVCRQEVENEFKELLTRTTPNYTLTTYEEE